MAGYYNCRIHRLQTLSLLPFLVIFISSAFGASFREEPMSKEISVGESVTLHCAVDGNLEGVSVFWWNINASRAINDNTRIGARYLSQDQIDRYSITGDPAQGEFNFHISSATYADIATYSCRIWDGTLWHFSRQVNLNVVRETPECTLQANLPVDVGNVIRLSCRSYSTDPNVQLHWLSKGRLIQSLPNLSSTTLSVIQHTLTEQDYDVPFMCLQATEYQRKACQIVPLHRQISVIVQDRLTTAYDGDVASFQCTTGFAKTSLTYSWFVDGVLQQESTDVLELSVHASNNGTIVTCKVRDSESGLSGENDAMLLVVPRPSTTPTGPATTNKATTIADTKAIGLVSNSEKTETSTSRMDTSTRPGPKIKAIPGSKIPQATSVDSNTEIPTPVNVEIENPRKDGSGKSSSSEDSDFMTAFILGSVLVGLLLIILIVVLLMFLARQSRQRRTDLGDGADEKEGSKGETVPLGVVTTEDSVDSNAGYVHTSPKQVKGKEGGIKETNVDYAVLDPNNVDDDSLSGFRMSNEVLAANSDLQDSKKQNDNVYRTYSSSIRDSLNSSISAYAISNVTTSTTLSDTMDTPPLPRTARPSQRCNSLQRPLPAEPKSPLLKSTTPKRYTYMAPLEFNTDTSPVHTSPPLSPRLLDTQRVSCMEALGEDDYAEISDMAQKSSVYKQSSQQTTGELTRLKSIGEMSSTPSVESQEDSALGSGSSMEALTSDECPYATISDEQARRNRQCLNQIYVPPAPPSSPVQIVATQMTWLSYQ
ncbi:uncharacterized protein [Amphiura filiformis]|uniref:uncharacterized protein n=1 Tax=Amphiura filiformis TaxID=82378 RepID=UPI003B21CEC8